MPITTAIKTVIITMTMASTSRDRKSIIVLQSIIPVEMGEGDKSEPEVSLVGEGPVADELEPKALLVGEGPVADEPEPRVSLVGEGPVADELVLELGPKERPLVVVGVGVEVSGHNKALGGSVESGQAS